MEFKGNIIYVHPVECCTRPLCPDVGRPNLFFDNLLFSTTSCMNCSSTQFRIVAETVCCGNADDRTLQKLPRASCCRAVGSFWNNIHPCAYLIKTKAAIRVASCTAKLMFCHTGESTEDENDSVAECGHGENHMTSRV